MTTRVDFLSGVRLELQDPGPTNYVWSDALLQTFLKDGLGQLSVDLLPVKEITLAAGMGQRDYPLAPGTLALGAGGITEVQFPAGAVVAEGPTGTQFVGADYLAASDYQPFGQRWELVAGAGDSNILRFRYALTQPGSIVVRAFTVYTFPGSDAAVLDVNGQDEALLKWAVCGRAMYWLEEVRGKRQGGSVPGYRGPGWFYKRLYDEGIASRKQARGIVSGRVVADG